MPRPETVPRSMRAVVLDEFGAPEMLRLRDVPTPVPAPGEVVVRVAAVEVSRTRDLGTRSGKHPFSQAVRLPHVLGGHCSGTVVGAGDRVPRDLVGQRVAVMGHHTCGHCASCRSGADEACEALRLLGIHRWGSYAQYTSMPQECVHPVPDDLDLYDAAAMAATGPVGLTQLRRARLQAGDSIVLPGATGALARTIVALTRKLDVRVIGLSRSVTGRAENLVVLDAGREDLADAILAAAGGPPAAAIDNVCAPDTFERYFPVLAGGARIVVSGAIGHPALPVLNVPARELYSRNLSLLGVRSHSAAVATEFWQLVRDGFRLDAETVRAHPLSDAATVHTKIADGVLTGHNVLVPPTATDRQEVPE
ncbi:alcohol dehydrogenase catalytic domain-containing protein [Streptomyces malaysiensis]|uniref:alcohol dehydrogenase catalytic domain-containing protein n=1 Tax=Streptomyces malaysiensis TaxID=92644 RepID=UPI0033C2DB88